MKLQVHELQEELLQLHTESYAWALRCCNNDLEMAKDILQTAYLNVLEGKAVFAQQSSLKTWFFSVIRYTAIKNFKLKYHASEMEPQEMVMESNEKQENFLDALEQALTQLSIQQNMILHLVFYHNMTIETAAAVMHISLGSARTHYERGKKRLRVLLHGLIQE